MTLVRPAVWETPARQARLDLVGGLRVFMQRQERGGASQKNKIAIVAALCNGCCASSGAAGVRLCGRGTGRGDRGNGPDKEGGGTMCSGRASSWLRERTYVPVLAACGEAMTSAKDNSSLLTCEVSYPAVDGFQRWCVGVLGMDVRLPRADTCRLLRGQRPVLDKVSIC